MTKRSQDLDRGGLALLPMLDLFQQLRREGMRLTIEQYDLLRQSLDSGYGLKDWDDLRDVCRMLWVKPSFLDEDEVFEQVFERYQSKYQKQLEDWFTQHNVKEVELSQPSLETPLGVLPTIPIRQFSRGSTQETQTENQAQSGYGMDAVKHDRPKPSKSKREYVVEVPISGEIVKRTWRSLRRPIVDGRLQEFDLEATVERIGREGLFTELVQRPVMQKKSDLLVLVDDSNVMLPFAPVIQPLVQMVQDRQISPAQIYRFRQCPTDYLYEWQRPLRGEPLAKVLGRLNRFRSVVMIVSEAGAGSPLYDSERVQRTGQFLAKLLPCVREVLWLNPLPKNRWEGTTAEPISLALSGRMMPFEVGEWRRLVQRREWSAVRSLALNSGGT